MDFNTKERAERKKLISHSSRFFAMTPEGRPVRGLMEEGKEAAIRNPLSRSPEDHYCVAEINRGEGNPQFYAK